MIRSPREIFSKRLDNKHPLQLNQIPLRLMEAVLCLYAGLVLVLVPLYAPKGYDGLASAKAQLFATAGEPLGRLGLVLCVFLFFMNVFQRLRKKDGGSFRRTTTVTLALCGAVMYGLLLCISYALSSYKEDALWGMPGWYMGLRPQLLCLFFGIMFALYGGRVKKILLPMGMIASFPVFLLACVNRFGIFFWKFSEEDGSKLTTIGNINWYCSYVILFMFPVAVYAWDKMAAGFSSRRMKIWTQTYLFVGFFTLMTQASASGYIALAILLYCLLRRSLGDHNKRQSFLQLLLLLSSSLFTAFVFQLFGLHLTYTDRIRSILTGFPFAPLFLLFILFLLSFSKKEKGKQWLQNRERDIFVTGTGIFVTFLAIMLILLVSNTLTKGKLAAGIGLDSMKSEGSALYFGEEWGSYRGATWMAGVYVFGEQDTVHKLFGVGPDSMYSYLDKDASKRLSRFVFRVFYPLRLINAHNEELTILINQGILGLAAFLLMMGSALIGLLRGKDKYPLAGDGYLYAQMCGICLLAYLANNLFSFEHTISLSAMYIIWGVGLHSFRMNGK